MAGEWVWVVGGLTQLQETAGREVEEGGRGGAVDGPPPVGQQRVFAVLRQPDWAVTTGPDADHSLRRPGLLLSAGWVGIALLGVLVAGRFGRWTLFVAFLAMMPGNFGSAHGWLSHAMDRSGPLVGETVAIVCFGALAAYYATLAVLERRAPHTVTGEVLRMEPRRRESAPRFLALDTGETDRTRLCVLSPASAPSASGPWPGVCPWSGRAWRSRPRGSWCR
ncbi:MULTISPECIES: hypothetical protein [unclassified Streptomyces]|uniref:FUSC family protein n=1 Tax=Streptomyces sp. NBC_00060 TaxID=2975636 RepID=A0AAU2GTZ9_9ACTN